MNSPRRLVRSVLAWPVETQLGARRNALVASTALTAARRERDDVEEFLETCTLRRSAMASAAEPLVRHADVI